MKEDKATPRPWTSVGATYIWKTGPGGGAVAIIAEPECASSADIKRVDAFSSRFGEAMANADLILRAVNSFSAFEAMKESLAALMLIEENDNCDCGTVEFPGHERPCVYCRSRAALVLAEEALKGKD